MKRRSSKQHGMSLVEVVLTLAISSLLIATVLSGRNSLRSQAQFSDGMERIKEQILAVKSDANTGKNASGNGTSQIAGDSRKYLLLGASMRFSTDTSRYKSFETSSILCETVSDVDLACGDEIRIPTDTINQQNLPWQIEYLGYTTVDGDTTPNLGDVAVVFGRDDTNGNFNGAWYPGVLTSDLAPTTVFAGSNQSEITLYFKSPDGRRANIIVNPATGLVTRKML